MPEHEHETTAEAWQEWKRQCFILECGEETRQLLAAFARRRLRSKLTKYYDDSELISDHQELLRVTDRPLAWLELEIYATATRTRQGKHYKDLLLDVAAGAPDPVGALQSYATSMFRTIARKLLAEHPTEYKLKKEWESIDAPVLVGDGSSSRTLHELLALDPGPVDQSMLEEINREAAAAASSRFEGLGHREKVVILAWSLRRDLNDPAVLLAAGCGKSVFYQGKTDLFKQIAESIDRDYADCEGSALGEFKERFIDHLVAAAIIWGKSERNCSLLFYEGEDKPRPTSQP